MKSLSVLLLTLVVGSFYYANCDAKTSGTGACNFKTTQGENIFLSYFPRLNKGDVHVEFQDGKCIQKATCQSDFTVKFEKCSQAGVTCNNVNSKRPEGVYPACCVKC